MKKNEEYTCDELATISHALIDLINASNNMDVLLADAVTSGVASGRLLGLFDAYDYLVKQGHTKAAATLKLQIDKLYPEPPMAKA